MRVCVAAGAGFGCRGRGEVGSERRAEECWEVFRGEREWGREKTTTGEGEQEGQRRGSGVRGRLFAGGAVAVSGPGKGLEGEGGGVVREGG